MIIELARQLPNLLPEAAHRMISGVYGCGVITAAMLFAQLAGTTGFHADASVASWAGIAENPVSSGRPDRFRLNRGGNRRANRARHTM